MFTTFWRYFKFWYFEYFRLTFYLAGLGGGTRWGPCFVGPIIVHYHHGNHIRVLLHWSNCSFCFLCVVISTQRIFQVSSTEFCSSVAGSCWNRTKLCTPGLSYSGMLSVLVNHISFHIWLILDYLVAWTMEHTISFMWSF